MKVGLVLGGGGVTGLAYHAGVLAALENDLGWDPRLADMIVGTSAGAITGSLLRRGVPASDLAALTVGAPTRHTPDAIQAAVREPNDFPAWRWNTLLRRPRVPSPTFIASWLRRPLRIDPLALLASIVADGEIDLAAHADKNAAALGAAWPEGPLWLCAVGQRTQHLVVFGRDQWPPLADAVTASCSIPGYFTPVQWNGQRFVDGGVRSPTNADVLKRSGLDIVIVVSPMSGRASGRFGIEAAIRRHAHRKARHEMAQLEARGCATLLLEPSATVTKIGGIDFLAEDRVDEIVGAAFLDAGEHLQSRAAEPIVAMLRTGGRQPLAG